MDKKTEDQIVGIKHTLNETLGESIHLADSQSELKKEMHELRKDCDSRLKLFKKLSFRFLLVVLALSCLAAVYAPVRVYFLEKSYVGKWLGCSTEELQENQAAAEQLQPGSDAELAEFMKDRAMDRALEGQAAKEEISYLENVSPAEAKRLADPVQPSDATSNLAKRQND
ncbi:MAG: hypothetical protein H8E20_09780 [Verrucomicrobia bacterium]|nr:hypothetical protein [Verrucomicrobiota bacterium]